mgnify:FL=1
MLFRSTQMQLDLAEDRLHLLTTGKPRPVFEAPEAGPVERPVAEDVEGYSYADEDAAEPAADAAPGEACPGDEAPKADA